MVARQCMRKYRERSPRSARQARPFSSLFSREPPHTVQPCHPILFLCECLTLPTDLDAFLLERRRNPLLRSHIFPAYSNDSNEYVIPYGTHTAEPESVPLRPHHHLVGHAPARTRIRFATAPDASSCATPLGAEPHPATFQRSADFLPDAAAGAVEHVVDRLRRRSERRFLQEKATVPLPSSRERHCHQYSNQPHTTCQAECTSTTSLSIHLEHIS